MRRALSMVAWGAAWCSGCANGPTGAGDPHARPRAPGPAPASLPASLPTPPGLRLALKTGGDVFVPDYLPSGATSVDLVVHFHGAPAVVEREFVVAGLAAVLITVNYRGLSGAYEQPFADRTLFETLLSEALDGLRTRGVLVARGDWNRICLSSFSAGYGAVRAVLKSPQYFERIDAIYLADSLYAGYTGEGDRRRVNPEHIADFCRFAAEAAEGRKTLIITHSYLEPGAYAGTHETAAELIARVGAQPRATNEVGPADMHIISRAQRGRLFVFGCAGTTGEDHLAHLRNMRAWYPLLPVAHRTR